MIKGRRQVTSSNHTAFINTFVLRIIVLLINADWFVIYKIDKIVYKRRNKAYKGEKHSYT